MEILGEVGAAFSFSLLIGHASWGLGDVSPWLVLREGLKAGLVEPWF